MGTAPLLMASTYALARPASMAPEMIWVPSRFGCARAKISCVSRASPCTIATVHALPEHDPGFDTNKLHMKQENTSRNSGRSWEGGIVSRRDSWSSSLMGRFSAKQSRSGNRALMDSRICGTQDSALIYGVQDAAVTLSCSTEETANIVCE